VRARAVYWAAAAPASGHASKPKGRLGSVLEVELKP